MESWKEQRKKLKEENLKNFQVGCILYSSRGWEQTNVEFFQIVERKKQSIIIKRICAKNVENLSSMSNYIKPLKDCFYIDSKTGEIETYKKRIGIYGVNIDYTRTLRLTDEKTKHFISSRA